MHFLHGRVELRKDLQALVGDKGFHDAAVFLFAGAGDQAAPFQAIEQARDVGIARDQPAADFAAGQARGARAAQDTQNVILGAGQARSLEEGLGSASESIGGAPESDEDLLLEVFMAATRSFFEPVDAKSLGFIPTTASYCSWVVSVTAI